MCLDRRQAVRFYTRNGFQLVPSGSEPGGAGQWGKDRLLRTYWFAEGLGASGLTATAPLLRIPAPRHPSTTTVHPKKWCQLARRPQTQTG